MSWLRHRRATAAFLRPIDHKVRASRRAAQPASGMLPPPVKPVPSHDAPTDTLPRHVSRPAAARPGAKTEGTVDTDVLPWVVSVCVAGAPAIVTVEVGLLVRVPVLPDPPPTATAVDWDCDL